METGRWFSRLSLSLLSRKSNDESGFIMVILLLALAVVSTLAVGLAVKTRVELKLSADNLAGAKAELQARSGIQYALAFIEKNNCATSDIDKALKADSTVNNDNSEDNTSDSGSLDESGWTASLESSIDGALAKDSTASDDSDKKDGFDVKISDEEGRLNLNTATTQEITALFGDLKDAVPAILDWKDTDDQPRDGGAESEYYQGLDKPIAPRNGPVKSVSELLNIKGITEESFAGDEGLAERLTAWSWEPDLAPDGKPKRKLDSKVGGELTSAPLSLTNAEVKALNEALAKAGQSVTMAAFAKALDGAVKDSKKKALALEYVYSESAPVDGGYKGKINVLTSSIDVLTSVVGTRAAETLGRMRTSGSLKDMWNVYTALTQSGDQQAVSSLEKLRCSTRCFRLKAKGFDGEISKEITAVAAYTGSSWRILYYEN